MKLDFNHIGIKSVDVDASVKFYIDVLGFKIDFEVNVFDKRCIFISKDALQVEIEEVKGIAPAEALPMTGLNHLSFEVENIEQTAEELKGRGAVFMIPPFQIRPTRKTAFIKAPDSVLIQLVEDLPEA